MSENLPRLYYLSDNRNKLLPEWAYFFMRVGYQLAEIPNDSHRVVIGLAIPARVFASSLVTTGIEIARANNGYSSSKQSISDLEPGTQVYIRKDDNRKHPGIVKGFREYYGKQLIIIRTGKSEEQGFPIDQYASRILVARRDKVRLPRYQSKGYLAESPSEFLQSCLGKELAQKHILDSSFEVLLIGKKTVINHEVGAVIFSCKMSEYDTDAIGCLQDILRVRQFSNTTKAYRSQCISSVNITPEKVIGRQAPPIIVVFDGAMAYIKLGYKWPAAHQVVLLDRTERQFSDSVDLINQNYAHRLAGKFKFPIRIPNGIEMMLYRDNV